MHKKDVDVPPLICLNLKYWGSAIFIFIWKWWNKNQKKLPRNEHGLNINRKICILTKKESTIYKTIGRNEEDIVGPEESEGRMSNGVEKNGTCKQKRLNTKGSFVMAISRFWQGGFLLCKIKTIPEKYPLWKCQYLIVKNEIHKNFKCEVSQSALSLKVRKLMIR